ncbi:hypothetical protein QYE77_02220 [Thermanaerothrix sp. 4228-RoL]|jgi:hypothetical protein|uniref:Uncharacterized protein n=1 Tax=Thermanaerothrix solaris TaxID=3058434 RepID=A0ABU3NJN3_9CHLR|nr:hypothetical protein [Thermanaerothrix sp. 4228-RoL]MDT8897065.1 hypothetical protein [Thermanaerothrix sp. 4228-RoL]
MKESAILRLRKAIIQQKTVHLDEPTHCLLCRRAYEQFQDYAAFIATQSVAALQGHPKSEAYPHAERLETAIRQLETSLDPEDVRFFRLLIKAKQQLDTIGSLINEVLQERES